MSYIENLVHDYGEFKIDIPRWELSDEGITALWGPSGSGKTSVFRLLIGLDPCPQLIWKMKEGTQEIDLAQLFIPEKKLGVLFQDLELFPHMTAEQNIRFAAKARKLSKEETESRLKDLISRLSLTSFINRKAGLLSGGEKQRTALARALIGRPRFLFLDEPFSALDLDLRSDARKLVKQIITDYKIPTLLITHDPEDLNVLADHVVKIKNGRFVLA